MNINKKIETLVNLTSITIISFAAIVGFNSLLIKNVKRIKPLQSEEKVTIAKNKKFLFAGLDKAKKAPYYNYEKLLKLMNEYRKIRKIFYANFKMLADNKDNIRYLTYFLTKLEKERSSFKAYVKNAKQYHRRSIRSNNRDSLRYYFRVIEDNIDGVKNMLQKLRQYAKLNNQTIDLALNSNL